MNAVIIIFLPGTTFGHLDFKKSKVVPGSYSVVAALNKIHHV